MWIFNQNAVREVFAVFQLLVFPLLLLLSLLLLVSIGIELTLYLTRSVDTISIQFICHELNVTPVWLVVSFVVVVVVGLLGCLCC